MADTVLALVAHPDDESFWMGGQLAIFAKQGKRVVVVVAADGTRGRPRARDAQFAHACGVLGVEGRMEEWFRDQMSDTVPQAELNDRAIALVRELKPLMVLTHYYGDLNHDHSRVCVAAMVASRDVCSVWMAEPEYPERVVGPQFEKVFLASGHQSGLSDAMFQIKWAACESYPEELGARLRTRSREALRQEPFAIIR